MLKHYLPPGLLKKVQMQGGARCAGYPREWVGGVLSPYVAAPRERANAPPAAVLPAAGKVVGPFSAAR
jgi:hypothetical protein